MVGHMGLPAITVAIVLAVMGLASLTVFIERLVTFARSRAASRQFVGAARESMEAGKLDVALAAAEQHAKRGHLARVVRSALATYTHAVKTADTSALTPVERTQRHMARYMEDIGATCTAASTSSHRSVGRASSGCSARCWVSAVLFRAFPPVRRPGGGVGGYQ
jgi:biopolymer transport protein ExbB/TolQ